MKEGLSLRGFARIAGVPVSFLTRIRNGERAVPVERIHPWADHFRLVGDERREFIDSAMWTSVPVRIRPWLEERLASMQIQNGLHPHTEA